MKLDLKLPNPDQGREEEMSETFSEKDTELNGKGTEHVAENGSDSCNEYKPEVKENPARENVPENSEESPETTDDNGQEIRNEIMENGNGGNQEIPNGKVAEHPEKVPQRSQRKETENVSRNVTESSNR